MNRSQENYQLYRNPKAEEELKKFQESNLLQCDYHKSQKIQYYCLKCYKKSDTACLGCEACIGQYHQHGKKKKQVKQHLLIIKQLHPEVKFKIYLSYLHENNKIKIQDKHVLCLRTEDQRNRFKQQISKKEKYDKANALFKKYRKYLKGEQNNLIGLFQKNYKQQNQESLTDIPNQLAQIGNLTFVELNFANNNIQSISWQLNFSTLKKLNLNNNKLKSTKGLSSLKNLQELFLQNNEIKQIHHVFACEYLKVLNAYRNKIEKIENSINNLTYLVQLDLSYNSIITFGSRFCLHELQILNISNNHISHLPDEIDLFHLIKFTADCNLFEKIPNLGLTPKLQEIMLNNNNITVIDYPQKLVNLKKLCLGNFPVQSEKKNDITKINNLAQCMNNIEILQFDSSQIGCYNEKICQKFMNILERKEKFPDQMEKLIETYFKRYRYQGIQQFLIDAFLETSKSNIQLKKLSDETQGAEIDEWIFYRGKYNNKESPHIQCPSKNQINIELNEQQIFKIILSRVSCDRIKQHYHRKNVLGSPIKNKQDYLKSIQELSTHKINIKFNLQLMEQADEIFYLTDVQYISKIKQTDNFKQISKLPVLESLIINNQQLKIALLKASLMENTVRTCLTINNKPGIPNISNFIRDTLANQNIENNIIMLQLPYIKLKIYPEILKKLKNVRRINLMDNQLETLQNLTDYELLNYLNLQSNKIFSMRGLQRLVNLTELNLKNNKIKHMQDLHTLEQLKQINLLGNLFSQFKLITEQLNYNKEQNSFPIFALPNLQILAIGHQIQKILFPRGRKHDFQGFYSLKFVILEGNQSQIKKQILNIWKNDGADKHFLNEKIKILQKISQ